MCRPGDRSAGAAVMAATRGSRLAHMARRHRGRRSSTPMMPTRGHGSGDRGPSWWRPTSGPGRCSAVQVVIIQAPRRQRQLRSTDGAGPQRTGGRQTQADRRSPRPIRGLRAWRRTEERQGRGGGASPPSPGRADSHGGDKLPPNDRRRPGRRRRRERTARNGVTPTRLKGRGL